METNENRDIFSEATEAVKDRLKKLKGRRRLNYPYDEEELKKWKDNKLRAEIIKMRVAITDEPMNEMLANEFAKLQREANRRGLNLSAEERAKLKKEE